MIVGCIVGSAHPPFGLRLQLYKKSPLYLFITRSRFGCFRSSGRHLLFTKDRHSIGFLKLLKFCPFRTQMGWGNGIYALPTSHPPLVAAVSYKEGSGWEMTSCSQCVVCSVCSIGWGCRSSPSRPGTQQYVHFKWILLLPAAICSHSIFNMSAITSCNMFMLNGFCRYQLQAARMSEIHSQACSPFLPLRFLSAPSLLLVSLPFAHNLIFGVNIFQVCWCFLRLQQGNLHRAIRGLQFIKYFYLNYLFVFSRQDWKRLSWSSILPKEETTWVR